MASTATVTTTLPRRPAPAHRHTPPNAGEIPRQPRTTLAAHQNTLADDTQDDRRKLPLVARLVDTVRHFYDLGFIAFGGPGVHVVLLRRRFVDKLKWVDETTFTDLFSLGNALPGPGSTQLAFSLAVVRNGTLAGLVGFLLWSLPGAVGMATLAAGVQRFPEQLPPPVLALLTGLNAAAVGLVAVAAFQLSHSAVTDPLTRLLVLGSASFGICYHHPAMYPSLVAAGGIATVLFDFRRQISAKVLGKLDPYTVSARRKAAKQAAPPASPETGADIELESLPARSQKSSEPDEAAGKAASFVEEIEEVPPQAVDASQPGTSSSTLRRRADTASTAPSLPSGTSATTDTDAPTRRTPLLVLPRSLALLVGALFLVFVITLVVVRSRLSSPPRAFDFFTNMVIAGVIIFGGGPVVVPLLRGYTVDNGWVTSRDFLLGFAILQAFPGPNFNFAAYLGFLSLPSHPILGALLGWLGIFSPGLLLKLALLPIYGGWRKKRVVVSALRGLNAAAVGLVYTAVWQLFLVGYIHTPSSSSAPSSHSSTSGPLTSDPFWGVIAAASFVASQYFRVPPAVTIAGGVVAGLGWFGVVGREGTERGMSVGGGRL
ncbi:hypothetical protein JCM8097_004336 [Rhodosporidiobolus ruineniae]